MNTEFCIFALIAFSLTGFAVAAYQIFCIKQECERIKKSNVLHFQKTGRT